MLELASSFTVAITKLRPASAVRPSHLPLMFHFRMTLPDAVNSTTVLSVLPSELASPCGPTPFWNAVKRWWPRTVMSSGSVSGSVVGVDEPAGTKVWCSVMPFRIWRTWYDGFAAARAVAWWVASARAAAGAAMAGPARARLARPADAAATIFAVRRAVGSNWPSFLDAAQSGPDLSTPPGWPGGESDAAAR